MLSGSIDNRQAKATNITMGASAPSQTGMAAQKGDAMRRMSRSRGSTESNSVTVGKVANHSHTQLPPSKNPASPIIEIRGPA